MYISIWDVLLALWVPGTLACLLSARETESVKDVILVWFISLIPVLLAYLAGMAR